jgi:hypothetical protein
LPSSAHVTVVADDDRLEGDNIARPDVTYMLPPGKDFRDPLVTDDTPLGRDPGWCRRSDVSCLGVRSDQVYIRSAKPPIEHLHANLVGVKFAEIPSLHLDPRISVDLMRARIRDPLHRLMVGMNNDRFAHPSLSPRRPTTRFSSRRGG